MDDSIEVRKLLGQYDKLVYEAVKAGTVAALPYEAQLLARAIQEHMHLQRVHNALEFADLREGTPYEIMFDGETVNPIAHVTMHAAVKGQLEQDPLVRAAFEKMVATGISAHHAEHLLGVMFLEAHWKRTNAAEAGLDTERVEAAYRRKLQKLTRDSAFRKKLARKFTSDHFAFE